MASNGWEYVGKKKNDKRSTKVVQKNQNSNSVEDWTEPTHTESHIKLSETTFQAFNALETKKQKQKSVNNNKTTVDQNRDNEVIDKKASKPKTKKKTISPTESPKTQIPTKPLSFEQTAKQLKVSEFEKVSEETKLKFPDMPLIWLKDIAYFLNGKFPSVEPEDVTFADKPIDYPSSALPTNVLDFIRRNIKQCPQPILQLIQEQLLQNLVKMNGPTMGFRIMLQTIARQYPEFTLKNIQKFIQQRNSYNNRQQICLTILWVASQSSKTDLKSGINIWLELMFPVIGQKAYTKFVIDSLRTLLELHSNTKLSGDVLEVKQFFVLFDFIHSPANGLSLTFQKQINNLYPKLKEISIRNNSHQNSRLYFPQLFDRLNSDYYVNQRSELLSELIYCLSSDSQCFSVWRSLYSQNLIESSQLLSYLNDNYRSLPSTLSKKLLRETVLSFRNTNDDARNQERVLKEGHEACEAQCEILMHTMSSWKFPIKSLLFVLTLILAHFSLMTSNLTNRFKSYSANLLKRTGTLPVVEQAYNKIETYSLISYGWLSANLPVYWEAVSAVVSPYLNLFWEKFSEVSLYLWNSTEFIRVWINKNIPPVLEKITDDYVPKVTTVLFQITAQLRTYFAVFWGFVVNYTLLVVEWLQTNVLTGSLAPENIQKVFIQGIEVLQKSIFDAYQWTTTQLKALTN